MERALLAGRRGETRDALEVVQVERAVRRSHDPEVPPEATRRARLRVVLDREEVPLRPVATQDDGEHPSSLRGDATVVDGLGEPPLEGADGIVDDGDEESPIHFFQR